MAFASGIAAQAAALFTLLQPGDHVVSSAALYGGTVNQFKHLLRKMSVELTWVDPDDPDAWRQAVRPNTKAFFGETIGNPGGNVLDIEAVASIAHEHDLPLIVDNTFATPYLCRPIEWGADIVIHSATKFIGGHGTSIGGVVVEAGTFNWSNGRFPVVADPSPAYHGLQFHETFGTYGYLDEAAGRDPTRPRRDARAAQRVPLPARAGDSVAANGTPRRQRAAGGGVPRGARARQRTSPIPACRPASIGPWSTSTSRAGPARCSRSTAPEGAKAARTSSAAVTLWSHLANVGDAKSLIIHPASTTHRQLSDDELRAAGVAPGTVRLSVGLESVEDLIWDLDQGFAAVAASAEKGAATR